MIPIEERCQAKVPGGRSVGLHRCCRRAVKDGYCKIHHPDTIKKKDEKWHSLWDQEGKITKLQWKLRDLCGDCVELVKGLGQESAVDYNIDCGRLAGTINALEKTLEEERKTLEEMKKK